jgi:hypothetical protein
MEPSRPLAKRRLEAAIEKALGASEAESFSLYELRTKLSVLTHSNVVRNLNALLSEHIAVANRDAVTGIVRFGINRPLLTRLSRFFAGAMHQDCFDRQFIEPIGDSVGRQPRPPVGLPPARGEKG